MLGPRRRTGFRVTRHGREQRLTESSEPGFAQPKPRQSTPLRRLAPRVLISLVIAGGFVWALERGGLPLAPPAGAARLLTWWAIPGFVVLTMLSTLFRTYRLVHLLRPTHPGISAKRVFSIGLVGYGAIFFAPLRLGEMVRPYLLAQDESVTFAQGIGVVTAERIIDGLVMVLMTSVGLAFSMRVSPLPDHIGQLPIPVSLVPKALASATLLFGGAFIGMAVLYVTRSWAVGFVRRLAGTFSVKLGDALARILERLILGFSFLPSLRSSSAFVLQTLGCWLAGALSQWVLMAGVGLPATPAEGCVTMGVIALGSLLPAGPGFFGAYQVASYTSLAMFFAPASVVGLGAMFVFGSYACHVTLNLLMTLLGFYLLGRGRRQAV